MTFTFDPKDYHNNWDIFQYIYWQLDQPLSTAVRYDGDLKKLVDIENIMNIKVPIKNGDKIAILYYDPSYCINNNKYGNTIILSEKFKGKPTVENVLKTLEKGLNKKITPYNKSNVNFDNNIYIKNSIIYSLISRFPLKNDRLNLINKYENGELKPCDLLYHDKYLSDIGKKDIYYRDMGSKGKIVNYYTQD